MFELNNATLTHSQLRKYRVSIEILTRQKERKIYPKNLFEENIL